MRVRASAYAHQPTVIKIGGSLVRSGRHRAVLHVLARSTYPIVIVPGGGVFADAVREAQKTEKFSDAVAHARAMVAMAEMGQVIASLSLRFVIAETLDGIEGALTRRQVPVWAPERMMADDPTLPQDWSVTSDALAARLAERLGAVRCLLVKSQAVAPGWTWPVLERRAMVDPWFGRVVRRAGLAAEILGAHELGRIAADVGAGDTPTSRYCAA